MKRLVATLAVALFAAGSVLATPTTITDTTVGTANNDGTINTGPDEYVGNSAGINSSFGGTLGLGTLYVDSSLAGGLNFGLFEGAALNDKIVVYIDSRAGGFADTTTFNDTADALRQSISADNGIGGDTDSQLTFAPGFLADYALAFDSGFAGVWELVGGGSHNFIASANLNTVAAGHWETDFTLGNISLAPGGSFDYVATYLNPTGVGGLFRSDEYHGVAAATAPVSGVGNVALGAGDLNTFQSIPEPSTFALLGISGLALVAARRRRR